MKPGGAIAFFIEGEKEDATNIEIDFQLLEEVSGKTFEGKAGITDGVKTLNKLVGVIVGKGKELANNFFGTIAEGAEGYGKSEREANPSGNEPICWDFLNNQEADKSVKPTGKKGGENI